MGMAGALAGLGKGMMGYADILGEKQKQDWLVQRDLVMHQRNVELEGLRNKNHEANVRLNDELAGKRWEKQFDAEKAYNIGKEYRDDERWEERFNLERKAKNEDFDMQLRKQDAQFDRQLQKELSVYEKKADLALDKSREARDKEWSEIQGTDWFNKLNPDQKTQMEMATLHPEEFKLISDATKDPYTKKEIMENYRQAYMKGMEFYDSQDEKQQKNWNKKAKAAGLPDGRSAYAEYFAAQATKMDQLFNSSEKQTDTPKMDPAKFGEYSKQIQGALSSGQLTLKEAMEQTTGTPFESVVSDWEKNNRNKVGSGGSAMKSVLSGVKDYATRNVEGGDNRLLEQLKKKYPNMTDEFYRLKLEQMR